MAPCKWGNARAGAMWQQSVGITNILFFHFPDIGRICLELGWANGSQLIIYLINVILFFVWIICKQFAIISLIIWNNLINNCMTHPWAQAKLCKYKLSARNKQGKAHFCLLGAFFYNYNHYSKAVNVHLKKKNEKCTNHFSSEILNLYLV